jgi:hypothetical protein
VYQANDVLNKKYEVCQHVPQSFGPGVPKCVTGQPVNIISPRTFTNALVLKNALDTCNAADQLLWPTDINQVPTDQAKDWSWTFDVLNSNPTFLLDVYPTGFGHGNFGSSCTPSLKDKEYTKACQVQQWSDVVAAYGSSYANYGCSADFINGINPDGSFIFPIPIYDGFNWQCKLSNIAHFPGDIIYIPAFQPYDVTLTCPPATTSVIAVCLLPPPTYSPTGEPTGIPTSEPTLMPTVIPTAKPQGCNSGCCGCCSGGKDYTMTSSTNSTTVSNKITNTVIDSVCNKL